MINAIAAIMLWVIAYVVFTAFIRAGVWVSGLLSNRRFQRHVEQSRPRELPCRHWAREPVTIWTGEQVAFICQACNAGVVDENWIATGRPTRHLAQSPYPGVRRGSVNAAWDVRGEMARRRAQMMLKQMGTRRQSRKGPGGW